MEITAHDIDRKVINMNEDNIMQTALWCIGNYEKYCLVPGFAYNSMVHTMVSYRELNSWLQSIVVIVTSHKRHIS